MAVVYDAKLARSLKEIVSGKFDLDPTRVTKAANLLAEMERSRSFGDGLLPPEDKPKTIDPPLKPIETLREELQAGWRAAHVPANPVTLADLRRGDVALAVTLPASHATARGLCERCVFTITRKGPEIVTTERGQSTALASIYFVSLIQDNRSVYLGVFEPVLADVGKGLRITKASRFKEDSAIVKLFNYTARQIAKNLPVMDGYSVSLA